MSEEERIWANALSDAIEPANEYARKIKDRYLVTAKNDMYGIDQTMNIISQAYLAGVEHQAEVGRRNRKDPTRGKRSFGRSPSRQMGWRIHLLGGHVDRHHAVPVREQQPVKESGMPRHGRTQTMETIQAPPVEAEDHQRPHHPKQTKTDAVRSAD